MRSAQPDPRRPSTETGSLAQHLPGAWFPLSPLSAIRLLVGVTLVAVGARGVTETDVWGHLKFGLDLLATGHLPAVDPYSFTSTQPWINHEWLSQVLFALAYTVGQLPMLALLRAAVVGLLLVVMDRALRDVAWPVRDALLAAAIVVGIPLLNAVRPQVFSLLLYALTLLGLSRQALWLPLVFALWANLHGGWMIGLGAVVVSFVSRPTWRLAAIAAACAAATLLTPYGFALWRSLFDATSRGWADVEEWQAVYRLSLGAYPAIVWTILLVAVLGAAVLGTKATRFAWVWTACVGAGAFRARRLLPFFAVTVVMLVLARVRSRPNEVAATPWNSQVAAIVAVYCLGTCFVLLRIFQPTVSCLPAMATVRPEASSVQFVRSAGLHGPTVMWFDWGLYAIWHVGDRLRVSMDNRRETVYSAATVADHLRFYAGQYPDYPDRIGAAYVWIPPGSPPVAQLERRGWYVIFRGPRSVILSRAAAPRTTVAANEVDACFPNP